MTEQPNIKREILEYLMEGYASGETAVSLRPFAQEQGYDEGRIATHSGELYPAINHGVSIMVPFAWKRAEVERLYDRWDAELPETIDAIEWVDRDR